MLKFNQIPPTVEGTEIDPGVIRRLAYGIEDRCLNNVAEACAAVVVANTLDPEVIKGIGEKAGHVIVESGKSKYPRADGESFTYRYDNMVLCLITGGIRSRYLQLRTEARQENELAL